MSDRAPFLRAVSEPVKLLGATPDLTKGAAAVGVVAFIVTLNGLYGMVGFALAQAVAISLTLKDPDIARTWKARVWTPRVRSFWRVKRNLYVP